MQGTFTTIRCSLNISVEQIECMSFMLLVYRTNILFPFSEKRNILMKHFAPKVILTLNNIVSPYLWNTSTSLEVFSIIVVVSIKPITFPRINPIRMRTLQIACCGYSVFLLWYVFFWLFFSCRCFRFFPFAERKFPSLRE